LSPSRRPAANRSPLETFSLACVFLSVGLGMVLFGAVRIYEIGPLATLVFVGLAIYGLRLLRAPDAEAPPLPPALAAMLPFLLYAGILSQFKVPTYPAREKFLMMCTGPVAYLLWTALAGRGGRWRIWMSVFLLLVSLAGWYAIVQHQQGTRMVLWMQRPDDYGMRASGTYACPNHFAHMVVVAICAGAALAATPGAGSAVRLIGGYTALLLLYPLFLTRSRAALLGLGAGLGVMALFAAVRRGARWFWAAVVAVPVALAAAGWAVWTFSPAWRHRFEEMLRGIETGQDFRPMCWKMTLHMIRLRPWFGWGGGSYEWTEPAFQTYDAGRTAYYAHNEPLHLAAEYGGIGIALLAVAVCVWLVRAAVLARRAPEARLAGPTIGALGVVTASLVHGLFDYNLHIYANSHAVLLVMGAAMAVHARAGGLPRLQNWTSRSRRAVGVALLCAGALLAVAMLRATAAQFVVRRADQVQERARSRAEFERTERLYRIAARVDAGNFNAWREIGRIRKNLVVRYPEAPERSDWINESFAAYRRAQRINPYDPAIWHGLAQLYRITGDAAQALAHLQEMTRLQPRRPYFHILLGFQYEQMGRWAEALSAFRSAEALGDRSLAVRAKIPMLRAKLRDAAPPPAP